MTLLDYIVFTVYLGMVILIGIAFSRKHRSVEGYFLAGRSVPGWVVGFSIVGTIIGSGTFIGHPGEVVHSNMWGMATLVMLLPVMLFVSRYVVVLYRRRVGLSVYGFLEDRFGYPARLYGSLAFLLNRIIDVSVTYYFLAVAITTLTGWDIKLVIVLVGILTVMYTLIGGISAVVWTDVLQSLMLIGGGLVCLGTALWGTGASAGTVLCHAWDAGKFSWGAWTPSLVDDNVWIFLALSTVWALQRYATDQHVVQRYLIAKSDSDAQRAALGGAFTSVPVWMLFAILGACVWSSYDLAGGLPEEAIQNPSAIMPIFFKTQLPVGVVGLIVAALVAGAMSSLDSDMNSMATVVVDDFFLRKRPGASERQTLLVGKLVVGVSGLLSVGAATQWIGVQSAVTLMADLFSVAAAGVLGLFLAGLLIDRVDSRGAFAGILGAVAFTVWSTGTSLTIPALGGPILDLGAMNFNLNTKLIGVFGNLVFLVLAVAASRRKEPDADTIP